MRSRRRDSNSGNCERAQELCPLEKTCGIRRNLRPGLSLLPLRILEEVRYVGGNQIRYTFLFTNIFGKVNMLGGK